MRVDPEELVRYGNQLCGCAEDARREFAAQNRELVAAIEQWGPRSRAALNQCFAEWSSSARTITDNVEDFGDSIRAAGYRYERQEQDNTRRFNVVAGKSARLNLD
ncbi:WXG100 family type VII secretion target [Gordonia crocea]|uniref:WXG100 family type VII secretion target n=1 Tax=Gordonia crocea TaxID=589162 RepID=A0A7I9UVA1_9ACTN|nr:hypothetical protein nbrc107697_11040 [Gordonia crocea]